MIAQLRGTVVAAGATSVIVDMSGFGVRASCPPSVATRVRVGQETTLATSLVVREDSLTLYAFADADERDCFELVQSASGIGPKIALAVVSVLAPDAFRAAIAGGNIVALTQVPGIGPKGAQKMIIELKDKVAALGVQADADAPTASPEAWRDQVAGGLESLGWSSRDASAACDRVAKLVEEYPAIGIGDLMRAALKTLAK